MSGSYDEAKAKRDFFQCISMNLRKAQHGWKLFAAEVEVVADWSQYLAQHTLARAEIIAAGGWAALNKQMFMIPHTIRGGKNNQRNLMKIDRWKQI